MSTTSTATIPGGVRATSGQLAAILQGELVGPGDVLLSGFGPIEQAGPGDLTFIRNERYARMWSNSKAGAAVISRKIVKPPTTPDRALIIVDDADLAMITLINLLSSKNAAGSSNGGSGGQHSTTGSIHPTAVIDDSVRPTIPASATIGPFCTIGPRCVIGERVTLVARVSLAADVHIGADSILHPGVAIYDGCTVGQRCLLHANAVIGADGFGFRPSTDDAPPIKVPHISNATLGDDVEIGASTCVDRGRLRPTIIGSGTKLDNQVQVGHGVQIGRNTLIAGCVGIAGSVTIGDHVLIGGHCGIADNLFIGDGARLGGGTMLTTSVPPGEAYLGLPGQPVRQMLRQWSTIRRLAGISRNGSARGTDSQKH